MLKLNEGKSVLFSNYLFGVFAYLQLSRLIYLKIMLMDH